MGQAAVKWPQVEDVGAFVLPVAEAVGRLKGLERLTVRGVSVLCALPLAHGKGRTRFPLVLVPDAAGLQGSLVEMSRLLASTRETQACILAMVDAAVDDAGLLGEIVTACEARFRVRPDTCALLAHGAHVETTLHRYIEGIGGITRCIVASAQPCSILSAFAPRPALSLAWTTRAEPPAALRARSDVRWKTMPEAADAVLPVCGLLHGLRAFWSRPHRYGDEVLPLTRPTVSALARALAPALRPLTRRPQFAAAQGNRFVLRAQAMQRDFEIFVAPPARLVAGRRAPAVLALDANGGFATVAETAARLAAAGEIEDSFVIGVGTPRAQGELEFGFRRFEELSPPPPSGYRYDDRLGHLFRALYALRGQDARQQLGQAPAFHAFLARQLMPELCAQWPIDVARLSLLGHSAAGTFVAYALAQPDTPFANFVCLSPGVAISGHWMLVQPALPARAAPRRIYAAIGAEERDNPFNIVSGIPETPMYLQKLRVPGLRCEVLDGETHSTVYPRAVAQGLRAVLAPNR